MTGKMVASLLGVAIVAGGVGGAAGWMLGRGPGDNPNAVIEVLDDHADFAGFCRQRGARVNVAVTSIEFDCESEGARPVTDDTVAEIAAQHVNSSDSIRKLALRGAQITNAGLEHLRERFDMLESLDLTNCKGITDAGLEHLARMPTLETIYVVGCDGLTKAGADALRAKFKAGFQRKDLRVNGYDALP